MRTLVFDSYNGKEYMARLVLSGDWYGREGCLENHKGAMIEFYLLSSKVKTGDLSWAGVEEPYYFVSRYYITTFFGVDSFGNTAPAVNGLWLDGGDPELTLSERDCQKVGRFILEELQK